MVILPQLKFRRGALRYNENMESKKILGVRIDLGLGMKKVLDIIEKDLLKDEKNHIICTTNPEFVMDAQEDSDFKKIINESSLSVPDGIGVIYAKKYLDSIEKLKRNVFFPFRAFIRGVWVGLSSFFNNKEMRDSRISGVDLTYEICNLSSQKNYSVFFLGGRDKNALGKFTNSSDKDMSNLAADIMRTNYPGVNIVGASSSFNRGLEDDERTLAYIKEIMKEKGINKIDFLFVAYNHVHQEKWIMRNKDKIPAKVSVGCGGTFDFIVGNCSVPSEFYVKSNLGWLYRLLKQPWRVKRIVKAFPLFPMKVFLSSVSNKRNKTH